MVHTPSRLVLASGNVTAWDGKVACNMVADRIVERIKKVRPLPEKDEKKKKDK
jgi:trehalose utilization protein